MPLLFLFVTLTIFAVVVFTLWSVSQAPEGIETEDGFQRITRDEKRTPTPVQTTFVLHDTQAHMMVE